MGNLPSINRAKRPASNIGAERPCSVAKPRRLEAMVGEKAGNYARLAGDALMRDQSWGSLAESEGFEPSDPVTQIGSLANYWFQPLTHDSNRGSGPMPQRAVGVNVRRCHS